MENEKKHTHLLDWQKLKYFGRLNSDVPGFFPELVNNYVTFAIETLAEMKKSKTDSHAIHLLGGRLRGMSSNIGAKKMETISLAIEEAGMKNRIDALSQLIDDAEVTLEATEQSLRQILKDEKGS
jgi:hypothetical protein